MKCSITALQLNDDFRCVIFPSSYLEGRFCLIFSRNFVSFVNLTHLGCPISFGQAIGVLHTLQCCLLIRFPQVMSFHALSGQVLLVSVLHFNGSGISILKFISSIQFTLRAKSGCYNPCYSSFTFVDQSYTQRQFFSL